MAKKRLIVFTKKVVLPKMLIVCELWPKNDFFHSDHKNVLFHKISIVFELWPKNDFFHSDHKNVLLHEILIVFELWPKNVFFIVITKQGTFVINVDSL